MEQGGVDFLTQQRIELLLSMRTKKLEEELSRLKEMMSNVQADMFQLRKLVAERPPTGAPQEIIVKEVVREPARELEKKEAPKQPHPRQGNYTSEDVSIEKYFNFSNKKS